MYSGGMYCNCNVYLRAIGLMYEIANVVLSMRYVIGTYEMR